jgi:anti-sigma factor RsiW
MSCDPVRVTGYVDGALPEDDRLAVEAHLASCPQCAAQVEAERTIAAALRALPAPELPRGLAERVRRRARTPVRLRRRVWIPAVAALLALALWARSAPAFVALEAALDHAKCFRKDRVPAHVWTGDPAQLEAWYAERGTEIPLVPASAGGLDLVGGRYCPFLDRRVAHVYYSSGSDKLSLYVVPGSVRYDRSFEWEGAGVAVNLIRVGGANVALVSDDAAAITAFRRTFERTVADAGR